MFIKAWFVVLGGCAALVLSPSATGRDQSADTSCLPISLKNPVGAYTYTVRIEAGSVGCGLARSVMRDAADWPPGADEGAAATGWHCAVGQAPTSWAISCRRGGAVVRAYGPVRERDPWVIAEAQLRIGLLAPTSSGGLVLKRIRMRSCGSVRKWLEADYAGANGATLTVGEGRPYACANLGLAPQLAVWRVHGSPARLVEFCAPTGCSRLWGDYALTWRERGLQIVLLTHGLSQRELLTLAQSMTGVPA
jgi:hypothetical protein